MAQNIKEYTAPDTVPRPTETGVEAVAAAARRSGMFFNQAAAGVKEVGEQNARMVGSTIKDVGAVAVDYAQHQEVSHMAVASAGLLAKATVAWDNFPKDGNDPTVVPKFMAGLEEELGKFKDNAWTEGGQKFAEQRVESIRNHFSQKTIADMSHMQGQATVSNLEGGVNSRGVTVFTDPSPHSLSENLRQMKEDFAASLEHNTNLDAVTRNKIMTTELAKANKSLTRAAIVGAASKSADAAETLAKDPRFSPYVDTAELRSIVSAAKFDARYAKAAADEKLGGEQDALLDKVYRNMQLPKEQQDPRYTRLLMENAPEFRSHPGDLSKYRDALDHMLSKSVDPNASKNASDQVSLKISLGAITTPKQVDEAYNEKGPNGKQIMSWQDRTRLQTELKDALDKPEVKEFNHATTEWLKLGGESRIDTHATPGDPGSKTTYGQEAVARWQSELRRRAAVEVKAGRDPHALLDPNNPKSMVTPEALAPYRTTLNSKAAYASEQARLDAASDRARLPENRPDLLRSPDGKRYYDPQTKEYLDPKGNVIDKNGGIFKRLFN